MKKKLKVWKQELETAKAAWAGAVKAKKSDDEIKPLHAAFLKAQGIVDNAEAGGATDEDEVSIEAEAGEKTIEFAALETMLRESIKAELDARMDAQSKSALTEEGIAAAVKAALEQEDKQEFTEADVKTIAASIISDQIKAIRKESKAAFQTDGSSAGRQAEIPTSYTAKGNLPLHAAQLFNVVARALNEKRQDEPDKLIKLVTISPEAAKAGQIKGEQVIQKLRQKAINDVRTMGYREAYKALTSTTGGSGDELVPTDLASELQRRFYLATPFGALIAAREIDMPTNPFDLPLRTTLPKFYYESAERTATTESSPGTAKPSLSAKKFMGETDFSYEVDEDAIIAILPFAQEQLATGAAQAYEDALINGDTAGTQDVTDAAGTTIASVSNHHYRAFDGIRKLALAVSALKISYATTGLVDEANARASLKALGKYGLVPREMVWVVGVAGYNQMMAISNVTTIEKYGPRATIVSGELTSFMGIPVLTSAFVRENVNASGVHDGVTTTKGTILLVNPMGFLTGRRRQFTVETDRNIQKQELMVVASFRRAFIPMETLSSTFSPASIGYNFTS